MSESMTTRPRAPAAGIRWRSVYGIWWRHTLALARVWQVALTWFVVEPAVVLLAVALGIGQLVGEMEGYGTYALFVAPGIIVGTAMFHAIFECSWSTFERIQQSLYETLLTGPITIHEIVMAELAFAVTRALVSTLAVGGFAIMFGWLPLASMPGLLLVSVGVGLVFGGIGLLFAATAPSMHMLSLVFTLVATPLYFFSGTFFPVSVLPEWLQPVAWAAPLTPLVELARAFAAGTLGSEHWIQTLYVIAMVAVLYPLATKLMARRLLK